MTATAKIREALDDLRIYHSPDSDDAEFRKVINGIEAHLDALEKEREWQPIETAPRDGTRILCAGDGIFVGFFEAKNPREYIYEDRWTIGIVEYLGYSDSRIDVRNPTHWMPLPKPPRKEHKQ